MQSNHTTCFVCGGTENLCVHGKKTLKDGTVRKHFICKSCNTGRHRRYRQTEPGRLAVVKAAKRSRMAHPERTRAYNLVKKAVQRGKITPQPCFVCDAPVAQAHHEDYSRPLDLVWLCTTHHAQLHRVKEAAIRAVA